MGAVAEVIDETRVDAGNGAVEKRELEDCLIVDIIVRVHARINDGHNNSLGRRVGLQSAMQS